MKRTRSHAIVVLVAAINSTEDFPRLKAEKEDVGPTIRVKFGELDGAPGVVKFASGRV